MIRNFKVPMLVAMVLGVFGTLGASGGQAAEFHCSVEPCTMTLESDGTAGTKTAHHVIVITNRASPTTEIIALTCDQITGKGTVSTKTFTTLTLSELAYDTCTFAGSSTTVVMNGCDYEITSHGTFTIKCPAGKVIEFGPGSCRVTIGPQGPLHELTYHNIGTSGTTSTKITMEVHIGTGLAPKMAVSMAAGATKAGCGGWDPTKTPITGEYTTGNTIIKAETDTGTPSPAEAWWA